MGADSHGALNSPLSAGPGRRRGPDANPDAVGLGAERFCLSGGGGAGYGAGDSRRIHRRGNCGGRLVFDRGVVRSRGMNRWRSADLRFY